MNMKSEFKVKLRRADTGEEQDRLIISTDADKAGKVAIEKARAACETMADRRYAPFEVVSVS
jgi:hypothetical protein